MLIGCFAVPRAALATWLANPTGRFSRLASFVKCQTRKSSAGDPDVTKMAAKCCAKVHVSGAACGSAALTSPIAFISVQLTCRVRVRSPDESPTLEQYWLTVTESKGSATNVGEHSTGTYQATRCTVAAHLSATLSCECRQMEVHSGVWR